MNRVNDEAGVTLADPNTLVLLGAGASVGAGFPTSARLHELLLARLDPIYANVARLVFREDEAVDPERLFRAMEFLNALEMPAERLDTGLGNESRDIAALVQTWCPDVAEYLDIRRHRVQGSPLHRIIDQLWRALVDVFSLNEAPVQPRFKYLADLVSEMRGQTVVTLNYDDALEHMHGWAMTFRIVSAPYPESAVPDDPLTKPLRLIKLHGSVDWSRDNATGDVSPMLPTVSFRYTREAWEGHTPGIIFGAGNKLRPDGPYLALYQEFREALARAHQVIVIGYSFRDPHVNEALRQWFLCLAEDGDLLRVGDVRAGLPPGVEVWRQQRGLDVEFIPGPAEQTMSDLVARRPRLMRN
jgi:NAD-dependent SIR2 family protein deacetylase